MRNLLNVELIKIEQALRLAKHDLNPKHYTARKVREALRIVQLIPHTADCDCDYCAKRKEEARNPALCSVLGCGFYRNDGSEFCPSHF